MQAVRDLEVNISIRLTIRIYGLGNTEKKIYRWNFPPQKFHFFDSIKPSSPLHLGTVSDFC